MKIQVLIKAGDIQDRVKELAREISRDYKNRQPYIISVLNGAFVFTADLIRHMSIPVRCDFIRLSSYANSTKSSGRVKIIMDVDLPVTNKDVIVVDDIIDSGRTTSYLVEKLRQQNPRSLKVCALLDKPDRRVVPVKIDYRGFEIPNKFVIGYGVDYREKYRQLKYIGILPGPAEVK